MVPISVRVDLEVQAGYVGYRPIARGHVARTERVGEDVCVDYDANGDLLGIELLSLDNAAIDVALEFAKSHDLAFPSNLSGALIQAN